MGLFGGGYAKPGPGVGKDTPKKKGIFLYFELFIRKFWKIIQSNALYFTVSLPILVIYYMLAPISDDFVVRLVPDAASDSQIMATMQMGFRSMFSVGLFAFWGSGPASAAYNYLMRCVVREQHAWIASDFFAKFVENLKQGFIVVIVDIAVYFLAYTSLTFYFAGFESSGSSVWLVICYVIGLALMIYTFMHYYIYQMMITFECTVPQLYRNSLILAFAKLPMNLILTILAAALLYVLFIVISPMISIVASFAIWVSVMIFPMIFYSSRVIQKNFLDGKQEKDNDDDEVERICKD